MSRAQRAAGADRSPYYVELTGTSVGTTFHQNRGGGIKRARAAAQTAATAIASRVHAVFDLLRAADPDAQVLFSTKNVMPGLAVITTAAAAADLAQRSDVLAVSAITPANVSSTTTDDLTRALATWQSTGYVGTDVKVGIIDTGIDFTHADFGGTGTAAAYTTAHASPADPNWYSTLPPRARTKIAGGYDFAGDGYTGGNAPTADEDPLDCYSVNGSSLGHGTHVAGILAGFGENADSSTFTGTYSGLTSSSLNEMAIAPGSAPGATIYALKVFGCTGSSSLVLEALDWALDPNGDGDTTDHLDIVNLSLGADYGAEDDPENAMIDKLAGQGVLSVVAAGNGGDLTLVGGSPGSATSALTVADSVGDLDRPDGPTDTLNSSSSRGTYGAVSTVKPDVAAPGTDIVSANMATGRGSLTLTGTSMATPHVAGIAALVEQAHPTWTPADVKADVMNTAVHDVTTQAGGAGIAYGPNRVGSGRVDAVLATTNTVLAYDDAARSAVSASFGVVDVPVNATPNATITRTRTVTISNNGTSPVTANVAYQPSTTQSGVSYSVSTDSVAVQAGGTANVTVTLTASANAIGRDMDPTMDPQQGGGTRDFTPLASGRLVITPNTGSALRVPVSAAVRLMSATTASVDSPVSTLTVTGTGFDASGTTDGHSYHGSASLLSVFTLGASSPKKASCTANVTTGCTQGRRDASGDIRYVGATSDYRLKGANASAYFAVTAWSEWTAPGTSTEPYVDIWTVSNPATELPDFEAYVAPGYPGTNQDYFGIWLYDFATGSSDWVADLNGLDPLYDSTVFDTDTLVIPVPLASLVPAGGPAATSLAHLRYQVGTFSPFAYGVDPVLDQIPSGSSTIAFDPAKPGITALNPSTFPAGSNQNLFWPDAGGVSAPITLDPGNTTGSILVLHQEGTSGSRAQVLTFATKNIGLPSITGTTMVGQPLTAQVGSWSPSPSSYAYQWLRNGAVIAGATASTYTLTGTEWDTVITVRVTAKPAGYPSATATSPATAAVAGTFINTVSPKVTGTAKVGYTLTASKGTWTPSPTGYAYQWFRGSTTAISGATAATYKTTALDVGKTISVKVIVSRAGYTAASKTSAATAAVVAGTFTNTVSPKVTGTAKVGYTLTAVKGNWSPTPTGYAYRWYRNGSAIAGATAATYRPTAADVGRRISVQVVVSRAGYTAASRTSAATTAVVAGTFTNTVAPRVSGTAKVGHTLTVVRGTWSPTPTGYAHQWYRNGSAISGARAATYKLGTLDAGKRVSVKVTVSRSGYTSYGRLSPATGTISR